MSRPWPLFLVTHLEGFSSTSMSVEERLRIAVRLFAALEDEVAGCFERDARVVVVTHAQVVRITGILLVDNFGHARCAP